MWPQCTFGRPSGVDPSPHVSPRPWSIICDRVNTTCNISFARRHCSNVPRWKDHCDSHYGDEYHTYEQQAVWQKIGGVWRRTFPIGVGCATAILGHGMMQRKNVNGRVVPYVASPNILVAKGHAFRKRKKPSAKVRRSQGTSGWAPGTAGATISGVFTTVVEETVGIIGEGVAMIEGWIGDLFAQMWPYLLMAIGIIIVGIIGCVIMKGRIKADLRPSWEENIAEEDQNPSSGRRRRAPVCFKMHKEKGKQIEP
ncbi:uncharacterized protein AKAME5_002211600 [Lates japonicus]|uniref:Uncharacterized protein n=1 Tax=Lates japonicus TaxID=270547 RepID=A0AAD3NAB8_LATJO|nr:uncharacterized protein AKAME5_002211600 [Lates japonicus]